MSTPIFVAAFYQFRPLTDSRLDEAIEKLEKFGERSGLKGLVIVATEGINGTISGQKTSIEDFFNQLELACGCRDFEVKWSETNTWPFRRFKVRRRDEIVTLGKPEVQALPPESPTHLEPEAWDQALEEDVVVLDTRNWYETQIGKFKGAIDPAINEFREFPEYLSQNPLPKDRKILIYCTGGIRCEKAITEMKERGYSNVYQLKGGILNYLAKFPDRKFEGECFVFDHRVAVDQNLNPSKDYQLCPHCGQPANLPVQCRRCDTQALVCNSCIDSEHLQTCSKNCAHHHQRSPGQKGLRQDLGTDMPLNPSQQT